MTNSPSDNEQLRSLAITNDAFLSKFGAENASTDPVPRKLMGKNIQICTSFEIVSRQLWHLLPEINDLLDAASKKYDVNFDVQKELLGQVEKELQELIPHLQITAVDLMFNDLSMEKWQSMAAKGDILDIFSVNGLEALNEQVNRAISTVKTVTTYMKQLTRKEDATRDEN